MIDHTESLRRAKLWQIERGRQFAGTGEAESIAQLIDQAVKDTQEESRAEKPQEQTTPGPETIDAPYAFPKNVTNIVVEE